MRVALLTEGGYPYADGRSGAWCDRLLRGLGHHDFEICAFSRSRRQAVGPLAPLPPNVCRVRTAPLWGPPRSDGWPAGGARSDGAAPGWLARRYAEPFAELTAALWRPAPGPDQQGFGYAGHDRTGPDQRGPDPTDVAAPLGREARRPGEPSTEPAARGEGMVADRFAAALRALADVAVGHGGLGGWLLSDEAVRVLAAACRAPGAPRAVRAVGADELEDIRRHLERLLRPLSLPWYGDLPLPRHRPSAARRDPGLGAVQLCHAVGTGPAALPGLLARHFHGVPLVVSPGGVGERVASRPAGSPAAHAAHAVAPTAPSAPVRALLAAVRERLTEAVWAAATPAGEAPPAAAGVAESDRGGAADGTVAEPRRVGQPRWPEPAWPGEPPSDGEAGGEAASNEETRGAPSAWWTVPGCPADRGRGDHAGPPGGPGRPVARTRESIPPGRRPVAVGAGGAPPGRPAGHLIDPGPAPPGHPSDRRA